MAKPSEISEERKDSELRAYEELYRSGGSTGTGDIRTEFLYDSTRRFDELIREYSPGARILEIGCGLAKHGRLAAGCGADVVSTDVSSEALSAASALAEEEGLQNIQFETADCESLEYEDNSFDVVVNHEVFSSIDTTKALPELARVLKPGGVLIGQETYGHNLIFNAKRKLNVLLGKRTSWAASHIWQSKDFDLAGECFDVIVREYYHLLVLFTVPLKIVPVPALRKPFIAVASFLDKALLKLPVIKTQAFKTIFVLRKK